MPKTKFEFPKSFSKTADLKFVSIKFRGNGPFFLVEFNYKGAVQYARIDSGKRIFIDRLQNVPDLVADEVMKQETVMRVLAFVRKCSDARK